MNTLIDCPPDELAVFLGHIKSHITEAVKEALPAAIEGLIQKNSLAFIELTNTLVKISSDRIVAENDAVLRESVATLLRDCFVSGVISHLPEKLDLPNPTPARQTEIPSDYIVHEKQKMNVFADHYVHWEDHAKKTLSNVNGKGLCCEFGVFMGGSIRFFATYLAHRVFHGFDSFQGLNEKWGGYDSGHLNLGGKPPSDLPANVSLHVGWFDKVLPVFAGVYNEEVAFMHIDCDLYSSTVCIFEQLGSRLRPGSVIMFDEYFTGHKEGDECKAFLEFIQRSGMRYRYLSCHKDHGSVSVILE